MWYIGMLAMAVLFGGVLPVAAASCPPILRSTADEITVRSVPSARLEAQRIIREADKCSDVSVALVRHAFSAKITIGKTRECKTADDRSKYGCGPGQIQPKLCVAMAGKVLTVSQCDRELASAVDRAIAGETTAPLEQLAARLASLGAVPTTRTITPAPAAVQAVTRAFENAGVPAPEARRVAEQLASKPDAARQILELARVGKTEEAVAAARSAGLNTETLASIGRLRSQHVPSDVVQAAAEEAKRQKQVAEETFRRTPPSDVRASIPPPPPPRPFSPFSYTRASAPRGASSPGSASGNFNPFSQIMSLFRRLFSPDREEEKAAQPTLPQQISSFSTSSASLLRDTLQSPSRLTPSQPAAEASIIVQQSEVIRGNPIAISWSSVGMRNTSPCRVILSIGEAEMLIAEKNEGWERIATDASSTPGTWRFVLRCTSASGDTLEREDSVTVR